MRLHYTHGRLFCLVYKVPEVVVLMLLEGSEDEVQHLLPVPSCTLSLLLLLLLLLSLQGREVREGGW